MSQLAAQAGAALRESPVYFVRSRSPLATKIAERPSARHSRNMNRADNVRGPRQDDAPRGPGTPARETR